MAASLVPSRSTARLAAREARGRCGSFFLFNRALWVARKTQRIASRTNSSVGLLYLAPMALISRALPAAARQESNQVEASGIDIMVVLDVSGSMLTKDFTIGLDRATRVDAIREVTRKFIEGRPNDRIGIIAFAGRPLCR